MPSKHTAVKTEPLRLIKRHEQATPVTKGNIDLKKGCLALKDEEIKTLKSHLKEVRKKHLTQDHRFLINSKIASVSITIKMFLCAYQNAMKEHKSIIQTASEIKNAPIRLAMIATIGLMASCFIVTLMQFFSDQMALLVGFVTLIFGTLEYWFRKGILETYLLEWTKKRSRLKYIQKTPNSESVSVYLIELEQSLKKQMLTQKKRIKAFQDPSHIRKEWDTFLKTDERRCRIKDTGAHQKGERTALIKEFKGHMSLTLYQEIDALIDQSTQLANEEISNSSEYDCIKKEVEDRIWKLWLAEQNESLVQQLNLDKRQAKKYLRVIQERLSQISNRDNKLYLNEAANQDRQITHPTPGSNQASNPERTANLFMDFIVSKHQPQK